jgi:hypothetical protein
MNFHVDHFAGEACYAVVSSAGEVVERCWNIDSAITAVRRMNRAMRAQPTESNLQQPVWLQRQAE